MSFVCFFVWLLYGFLYGFGGLHLITSYYIICLTHELEFRKKDKTPPENGTFQAPHSQPKEVLMTHTLFAFNASNTMATPQPSTGMYDANQQVWVGENDATAYCRWFGIPSSPGGRTCPYVNSLPGGSVHAFCRNSCDRQFGLGNVQDWYAYNVRCHNPPLPGDSCDVYCFDCNCLVCS